MHSLAYDLFFCEHLIGNKKKKIKTIIKYLTWIREFIDYDFYGLRYPFWFENISKIKLIWISRKIYTREKSNIMVTSVGEIMNLHCLGSHFMLITVK